jgi:antibiotic biosynthesis monooxygenase (ABM) superfamily enzyme
MESSSPELSDLRMQVHGAQASSVIVHRLPPERVERFLELQRGITQAAEDFRGYEATDVYPPTDRQDTNWVVVIHFDAPETLQRWLDSPVRAEWVEKLRSEMGDFRLKSLPTGFAAWFAGLVNESKGGLPPSWKMALTVLLALYPTVMLLTILLVPHLSPLGLALSMLISNALSVSTLQWVVMPVLEKLLGPWLRANQERQRAYSLGGLVVLLVLLGAMALLFRLING